jgi:hypothetical protein
MRPVACGVTLSSKLFGFRSKLAKGMDEEEGSETKKRSGIVGYGILQNSATNRVLKRYLSYPSPRRRNWKIRPRWPSSPSCSCRDDVNRQSSDRTAQRIPVYAKYLGSSALVPALILEHCEDERLLKLSHRFRASHTGFVHLQDDTLQLFLHGVLSSYGARRI